LPPTLALLSADETHLPRMRNDAAVAFDAAADGATPYMLHATYFRQSADA